MSEIVKLTYSIEQVLERMVDMERGFCPLCGGECVMRLGKEKPRVYLYCSGCGFQGFIRKETGIRNYGALLRYLLEVREGERNEEDTC